MRGSDWVTSIPEKPGEARDAAILKAVKDGNFVVHWQALEYTHEGAAITLLVSQDALRIGNEENSVRVAGTARLHQLVADNLGCLLPTPKISDLVWSRSLRLPPRPQTPDTAMGFTSRFVQHHDAIEKDRAGRQGFVASFKDWVICKAIEGRRGKAANYGWHSTSAPFPSSTIPGTKVLQPISTAHNLDHVDYSQMMRLVRRVCWINGERRDLLDVLKDPVLAKAVSHEGALGVTRYDAAPLPEPKDTFATAPGMLAAGWDDEDEVTGVHRPTPIATEWRVLKKGMTGPDVKAWQMLLIRDGYSLAPGGPDGKFGPTTEKRTMQWQIDRGLVGDGTVGPRTKAAIGTAPLPSASGESWRFVQAKNYTVTNGRKIDWIVVHSMEAAEKPTTAEAVAAWFAGANAPKASAHACIDNDSIVLCVMAKDVAWAAPGANGAGYHLEFAGYSKQTREEWLDEFGMSMLKLGAEHAGRIAVQHGIPAELVDVSGLKAGKKGFTEHRLVSLAFRKSDHTDPGKHFPWDVYLALVAEEMKRWKP